MTNRNLKSKGQGYTLKDKEIKKSSQEDVDKSYLRLHTSLEDACGVTNGNTAKEDAELITKSIETDNLDAAAFTGQVARLGGIAGVWISALLEGYSWIGILLGSFLGEGRVG